MLETKNIVCYHEVAKLLLLNMIFLNVLSFLKLDQSAHKYTAYSEQYLLNYLYLYQYCP